MTCSKDSPTQTEKPQSLVVYATVTQLAQLGEVLVAAFQENHMPTFSMESEGFLIQLDDDPGIVCSRTKQVLTHSMLQRETIEKVQTFIQQGGIR